MTVTASSGPAAGPAGRSAPSSDLVVRAALSTPCLTVARLAQALDVPRSTLEAYRLGTRRMRAPVRARLAEVLEAHAAELRRLAAALIDGADPAREEAAGGDAPDTGAAVPVPFPGGAA